MSAQCCAPGVGGVRCRDPYPWNPAQAVTSFEWFGTRSGVMIVGDSCRRQNGGEELNGPCCFKPGI